MREGGSGWRAGEGLIRAEGKSVVDDIPFGDQMADATLNQYLMRQLRAFQSSRKLPD